MFGKAISNVMIKPGLAPVFDSPENHGLNYEDVTFKAGTASRCVLIKGGTDKVIVQSHFGVHRLWLPSTTMERMLWNHIHFLNQTALACSQVVKDEWVKGPR